jgi:hypothetical protein
MPTVIADTLRRINAESNEAPGAAQNGAMGPTLHAIAVALAELDDVELHALIAAANGDTHTAPGLLALIDGIPQMAPCLLAWVATACNWELQRRQGLDYELQPPKAAIPPEEEAACIDAAISLCAMFSQGTHGAHALFDALAEMLAGGGRKQSRAAQINA